MKVEYIQMQIRKIAQGTKVLGLSSKKLSDIAVNLPSKKEQGKIVSFLIALDNKINRTENQILQTQQYKKGLLQKMFC
jgi:type I restriction enzyme S subunit